MVVDARLLALNLCVFFSKKSLLSDGRCGRSLEQYEKNTYSRPLPLSVLFTYMIKIITYGYLSVMALFD